MERKASQASVKDTESKVSQQKKQKFSKSTSVKRNKNKNYVKDKIYASIHSSRQKENLSIHAQENVLQVKVKKSNSKDGENYASSKKNTETAFGRHFEK